MKPTQSPNYPLPVVYTLCYLAGYTLPEAKHWNPVHPWPYSSFIN